MQHYTESTEVVTLKMLPGVHVADVTQTECGKKYKIKQVSNFIRLTICLLLMKNNLVIS